MTTLYEELDECANCGSTHSFTAVGSTNAFGSPDLDLRPPPMERDILPLTVRECPDCGLCASRLSDVEGLDIAVVGSPEYTSMLRDPSFPTLARQYRAMALLAEVAGNSKRAGSALLRAAWACDDLGDEYSDAASRCRKDVLATLKALHEAGESLANDALSDQVLQLDLLRRSGDFDSAEMHAAALSIEDLPDLLAQIVSFQGLKAHARDRACYTVEEAISQK